MSGPWKITHKPDVAEQDLREGILKIVFIVVPIVFCVMFLAKVLV